MDKQRVIASVSCILNRGTAPTGDTAYFADRLHSQLVERLRTYLDAHHQYLADMQLETSHALNEKGVDLLLKAFGTRIGFQVKSHFDVTQNNFNPKVHTQLAQSQAHALDKYYILVCCPLEHNGTNYTQRISTLLNDLSLLKSDYHCAFGPENVVRLFNGAAPLTDQEFGSRISQYTYEPTDWKQLLDKLSERVVDLAAQVQQGAAAIEHDRKIFAEANKLVSEESLGEFLEDLAMDHKFREGPMGKVDAFRRFLRREENKYTDAAVRQRCDTLLAAVESMIEFTFHEFKPLPHNQTERYCMMPEGNIDRSVSTTPEQRNRYSELEKSLKAVVKQLDAAYLEYRKSVRERLAV